MRPFQIALGAANQDSGRRRPARELAFRAGCSGAARARDHRGAIGRRSAAAAAAHDVSVILLDIQMPGLDGFEVARLIRGREKERYTPIIFLTAFEDHRFTIPRRTVWAPLTTW